MSAPDIPLIDFAPFLTAATEAQQPVAQAVFRACHEVGFLYVKHHGIPQAAIEQAFAQSRAFFARPLAEKQALAWSDATSNRGYVGIERERLDETQPGDLKEAFNVGKESSARARSEAPPVVNCWPEDATFQPAISEFFQHCTAAATRLLQAFAIALSLPPDYLSARHQTHDYTLRLLHYPPLTTLPQPGQLRAGAHSDYGSLTLLFQDRIGGLEVLSRQGWVTAPVIPGAILVNTGDLMQRWSNHLFRSTQHRVRLPEETGCDRYSIAFFCQPDAATEITCLPSCQSADRPAQYPPVTAGDYLLSRLQATY
ncbi:MAG: isopenicillin N synthase family oxygenase [Leptolyngbya sp. SIO4C1]|nr:isopenicillin N synthase family oxygenase [Leptolyngbya sp. SIO4C1]